MVDGVQNHDLDLLKSVTQPISAGQRAFFVENMTNGQANQYQSRIASMDRHGRYYVWANQGVNVQPVVVGHHLYYLHQNRLMRRSLISDEMRPIAVPGKVKRLLHQGDYLYLEVVRDSETAKFKTQRFPRVRVIHKLVNKQDGYGWLPNHVTYEIIRLNLTTQKFTTILKSKTALDLQSVSSDGQKLIYLQTATHYRKHINRACGAFLYDIKQQQSYLINQTIPKGVFHTAQFAPDGKWIALIGNDNRYPSVTVNDFWRYDLATKRLVNLTRKDDSVDAGYAGGLSTDFAQQRSNIELRWLDAHRCVFHAYHHAHSQLYVSDGRQVKLIDDKLREVYDFSVVNPHLILLSSSKQTQPCELRLLNLRNDQERCLYNPNDRYEESHCYAQVSPFQYHSKDQSVILHGWVMHALNQQTKSPVILYVHGGPHDAYGESFFHEFQVLANHGYSLVYVNPRGSTTYGQAFETNVIGHYGQHDYADVMSGLSAALQKFSDLDRRQVFIMGGSYGGFMVLWAIGHTHRFKGAIAQRPLADWAMMYGTSDIGIRFAQDELGKDLYRDHALQFYWQQSPIAYAENVTTPLLLQHGEYDMRCPASQSEAYFTAVKQTGDEVTYRRYPQSYHGVSRHGLPSMRIQRIHDILNWLDNHLN